MKDDAVETRSSTKFCDRASYKSIIRTERFALLTFCSCNPVDYLSANHFCIDDVSGKISVIGRSATKAADTTITDKLPGFTSPTVPLIVVLVIPTESMVSEN